MPILCRACIRKLELFDPAHRYGIEVARVGGPFSGRRGVEITGTSSYVEVMDGLVTAARRTRNEILFPSSQFPLESEPSAANSPAKPERSLPGRHDR